MFKHLRGESSFKEGERLLTKLITEDPGKINMVFIQYVEDYLSNLFADTFGFDEVSIHFNFTKASKGHICTYGVSLKGLFSAKEPVGDSSSETSDLNLAPMEHPRIKVSLPLLRRFQEREVEPGAIAMAVLLHEVGHNLDFSVLMQARSLLELLQMSAVLKQEGKYIQVLLACLRDFVEAGTLYQNTFTSENLKLFQRTAKLLYAAIENFLACISTCKGFSLSLSTTARKLADKMDQVGERIFDKYNLPGKILKLQEMAYTIDTISWGMSIADSFLSMAMNPAYATAYADALVFAKHSFERSTLIERKGEEFADNFVAAMGYGPELAIALMQLDSIFIAASQADTKNPFVVFLQDISYLQREIYESTSVQQGHSTTGSRIRMMLDDLTKEMEETVANSSHANLLPDIIWLQKLYDEYMSTEDCANYMENAKEGAYVLTKAAREFIRKVFGGRPDILAKSIHMKKVAGGKEGM